MPFIKFGDTVAHVLLGGPVYTIDVEGKPVTFENHPHIGPQVLKKNGDPKAVQPGEHHPFWNAYEKWAEEG